MANHLETPGQLTLEPEQQVGHGSHPGMPQTIPLESHHYQQLALANFSGALEGHHGLGHPQSTDEHGHILGQNYFMGQAVGTQAMDGVTIVATVPGSEAGALQVAVPTKYVCTCGCLQRRYLSHPEELEALEAQVMLTFCAYIDALVDYALQQLTSRAALRIWNFFVQGVGFELFKCSVLRGWTKVAGPLNCSIPCRLLLL
jgi:hypothetical protein